MITSGRRISVVGCSGAGKTMLSRRLAQQLGYRHIELDALFHQPAGSRCPPSSFSRRPVMRCRATAGSQKAIIRRCARWCESART
ncbi:AAA family ATPase [Stutzerimonas kunmingensis]|uniref:AAA family ATPase n=1 Tax=Stutzerimonas kunmingensis TaxID=1211807 RepID=UPI0037D02E3B